MRRTPKREADVARAGAALIALADALEDCGVEPKVVAATMRAVADVLARAKH